MRLILEKNMGSSKMNTMPDPLAQQKTSAANLGLQNYQTASQAIPGLQGYYNQNFGQSPMTTLGNEDPLSQAAYKSVEQDVTGTGGPYASLKQNLLGSFDTGQTQASQTLQQQLQAQGLLGSGAGMAVLGNQGVNAAQQRALLGSNVDVQELNMANQMGQQLLQNNQQQGFNNPMTALGQIQSLSQAPQFQNLDQTYYQQPSTFSQIAPLIGQLGGAAIGAATGNPMAVASGLGGAASSGMNLGAFPTANNFYSPTQSQLNNPLSFQGPYQNTYSQ